MEPDYRWQYNLYGKSPCCASANGIVEGMRMMLSITDIVKQVIAGYAGNALNGHTYLTMSADEQVFTVVGVAKINGERFVTVGLVVRLSNELIIIERDQNDKLVVDALLQAGIPRSQIILAYAGEPVPEAV